MHGTGRQCLHHIQHNKEIIMDVEETSIDRIVDAWIKMHEAEEESEEYFNNFWAVEKVDDFIQYDPGSSWEVILSVLEKNVSPRALGVLAAGPLEDLLSEHGEGFIDRVELEARKNETFKNLLGGVWQNDMSDEVWTRVQAVAGKRW